MANDEKRFFRALGARIADRRKELRLSQAELGQQLGCSQQRFALYEAGHRRVPASMLPLLSEVLGLSVDELVGVKPERPKKRGPAPKLQKQLEQLSELPKAKQRFVMEVLDTVLEGSDARR